MKDDNSMQERAEELRKAIDVLEYDIPHIKNKEVRQAREKQLAKCRRESEWLLKQKSELATAVGGL